MKFATYGKTPKPEVVCSKDETRPVMTRPWLMLDKPKKKGQPVTSGRIVATNSYILTMLPVEFTEDETPTTGAIERKVFTEGRKAENRGAVKLLGDKITVPGLDESFPPPDADVGQFPDVDRLMPDEETISSFKVGLNAAFLKTLADGLGAEQVVLEFVVDREQNLATVGKTGETYLLPGNLQAIRVRPLDGQANRVAGIVDGPVGIMMPIRIKS